MPVKRPIDQLVNRAERDAHSRNRPASGSRPRPEATNTSIYRTAPGDRPRRSPEHESRSNPAPEKRPVRRPASPAARPIEKPRPKPTPAPETENPDEETPSGLRVWGSLILLFITAYLAVSLISYLSYWSVDQNIANWERLFTNLHQDALNWGGRLGAILSDIIIRRWFGLFGLLLPLVTLFAALKLLRSKHLRLHGAIRSTILLLIVGSVALGQFFGTDASAFGSGWGGTHGIFISEWLEALLGDVGTTLLLSVLLIGTLYYACGGWIVRTVKELNQYIRTKRQQLAERRRRQAELAEQNRQTRLVELEAARLAHQAAIEAARMRAPGIDESITAAAPATPSNIPEKPEESAVTPPSEAVTEPEPALPAVPEPAAAPPVPAFDPDCIVEGPDGWPAYLAGYDAEGTPVIYSLDRAGVAALCEAAGGDPAAAFRSPFATAQAEEAEEEAISVTVRPADDTMTEPEPAVAETIPTTYTTPVPAAAPRAVAATETAPGDTLYVVDTTQMSEAQVDDEVFNSSDLFDPTLELSHYRKPPIELLDNHTQRIVVTDEELMENKNRITTTLENFGIRIDTIEATIGPTVTLYEIVPAPGVRISKIKNLEDDIALSLSALGIRIIAPIPGRGTIGIEVPNKDKETVSMYSVIKSARFHDSKAELPVALGKTIENETFVFDLAKMPHLLVAGATGQGKSVGLNAIITSLLYKKHPSELKFILVDPKKVELTLYAKLERHFLAKMPDADEAIITDTQKVIFTLNSICIEMDARYDLLKAAKVRNIKEYNEKFINRRLNPEKGHRYLPYFVVVVDEFADLIMTAGREIETPIARIAQLARAVGIHLIIATQRPTTNIITGVIKANFPARIAFRVTSMIDSRTILDQPGANQLIGRGDMLISTGNEVTRVQCAFIDTPEVDRITEHIFQQQGYTGAYALPEYHPEGEDTGSASATSLDRRDPLFDEVARYVVTNQSGSASTIQRKFAIGFNRAGRIVDQLEAAGIVGRSEGSKPRQVLISDPMSLEMLLDNL